MEDHPKWKKWCDAYDALVKAAENLRNNNRLPPSDPVYEAAVRRHKAALDQPMRGGLLPMRDRLSMRSCGPVRPATTPSPRSSMSAMFARHGVAYGPMYRLEQSCTLSAAQAAPTHDGYKGSAVNLSIGRLCYVR